ncbi:MAG: heparinase II/III family protein [Verrucomicrobiota bacterium]|jgi:hypothetical protein
MIHSKFTTLFFLAWLACTSVWAEDSTNLDILAGLRPGHPRLILVATNWDAWRARPANQAQLILAKTVTDARTVLSAPPLAYQKEGKRLLAVSREALRRIELCSFAYRVTGEKVFLDRAQQDMLGAAAFADWNPTHFLDTAEMTAALAIGYDWLFDALPPEARAAIRQAILQKGIQPGLSAADPNNWWQSNTHNWNQVCFGGLTLGALAIADENPQAARQFLTLARKNSPNGLQAYAPDGVYPEGPGYWSYGTTYQVLMIAALQSALGTDWNLPAQPGFLPSAAALVQQTGPTGLFFNFSDSGAGPALNPALFWFAQKLRQPGLVYSQNRLLLQKLSPQRRTSSGEDPFFPFLALWTGGLPDEIPPPSLPLVWHGGGSNPVGVFRTSWTDTNALFLAFKGGSASLAHAHMDAGSFVLDAGGVRWACDLGAQDYYSIESKGWDLFNMQQNSDRWRVYRLNNFSHNTLTLGGALHNVAGDARITAFTTNSATVDLSKIFAGQAGSVLRHFSLGKNNAVVVCDDIAAAKPALSVRWQMVTRAAISVDDNQATLRQNGRVLSAKILAPAGARFEVAPAQPPDDGVNAPNPNTGILAVNAVVPATGSLALEIQLQPASPPPGQ